jgi:hypothetical protein
MNWQNPHHMNPLRTNPLRTWGHPRSYFRYFPALKNPRVGWKILNRFLSNDSAVPCFPRNPNLFPWEPSVGRGPLLHLHVTVKWPPLSRRSSQRNYRMEIETRKQTTIYVSSWMRKELESDWDELHILHVYWPFYRFKYMKFWPPACQTQVL